MKALKIYTADDYMLDMIADDYNVLPLLSRFSIALGFDNKTIRDICRSNNIDVNVFLLVINYIISGTIDIEAIKHVSAVDIVDFLHNSHEYFLKYKFAHIRHNLVTALDEHHSDINPAILNFYDNFVKEVENHFGYEESVVFPYIKALSAGEKCEYSIDVFKRNHEEIGSSLIELKNIILRYYTTSIPNRMYDVLVDLYNCEEDLDSHSNIENRILIPMVATIERLKQQES